MVQFAQCSEEFMGHAFVEGKLWWELDEYGA